MDLKHNMLSTFYKNCRICLKIHQQLIAIQSLKESNEFNLLLKYLNIEVMTNIRYPTQICTVCLDQLNNIVLFKKKCESALNLLKTLLKNVPSVKIENGEENEETINDNNSMKTEKSYVKSESDTYEDKESEVKINFTTTNDYKCQYCDKTFKKKFHLVGHETTHLNKPNQLICDQCPKTFSDNDLLLRHVRRIHMGEKPFVCTECSRTFSTHCSFKFHKETHHGGKPRKKIFCKECGYAVTDIIAHKKYKHSIFKFQCKYCKKKFPFKSVLTTHVSNFHENCEESFKILCTICGKMFRRMSDLNKHNKVRHSDERNYPCKYCEKRFKTSSELSRHTRSHLNIRPHKCTYCEREFTQKRILINHMRTHTGERPFKCTICSKDFRQKSTLRNHTKLVHEKLNIKK